MKASYFSAQSLGWLGAAVNPLVSGVVLTNMPPSTLFIILAMVIIAAWVLMLKGIRAKSWGRLWHVDGRASLPRLYSLFSCCKGVAFIFPAGDPAEHDFNWPS